MTLPMPSALAEAVAATQQQVEPVLRKAVDRLDPRLSQVCAYHLGWVDLDGAPAAGSSGKALRPTLVLLAARACAGDPAQAVPAAVAVELVHNFSLLHDDVMDGDTQRRHRRTVWAAFGIPTAVLAGDALLALAMEVVLRAEPGGAEATSVAATLAGSVGELITGQSADLDFETRDDVDLAAGLAMADGKTASLLRACAVTGALSVAADQRQVELLGGYAGHVGTAFQVVDDLLGIWGEPDRTGKPRLADLRSRKKSLPVLAALGAGSTHSARLAELYRRPEPFEEQDLELVADLVQAAGGRQWAVHRAEQETDAARACLAELDPPAPVRAALEALADYVTERDR